MLLLQEAQTGVIGNSSVLPALAEAARESGATENMVRAADAARRADVRVIHCTAESLPDQFGSNRNARLFGAARRRQTGATNTPGSPSVRPIPELGPGPSDIVLPRYHGLSPMTGTHLDSLLRNEGVTTVVVVGVSLNVAIPNLVFDSVNRSYQVVVVRDAVAGVPADYGRQVIEHTLGLVATLVTADELVEAWG